VPLHADVETSDLDGKTAAQVEGALERLMNHPQVASAPQPDRFSYEIAVPDRGWSASVAEQDLPRELHPLVELLSRDGTVGKS
jgi:hypothetical protein